MARKLTAAQLQKLHAAESELPSETQPNTKPTSPLSQPIAWKGLIALPSLPLWLRIVIALVGLALVITIGWWAGGQASP